ncbi:pentatricopeptide repeat-containing protein At1g08070, chloroplastic-like [Cryptomeria japonica]|uniref:pentatricopeptide repeat-containing protein At1g08070, chloroplastic-like n=1 Tax=Cryptomeria japonica TaxID=3369 RepID=UPI0027DA46FE|nr:pentatricopeptide repeat-containing protein At1g08070, chloroplastic-like [Cryptomeria japonica]
MHIFNTVEGRQIHPHITLRKFASATATFFQNKLLNMYLNCGSLVEARQLFDQVSEPDVFSWNIIIIAYRRHGFSTEALKLFHQMQRTGTQPNQFTFASILPACAKLRDLKQGMYIHQRIIERGILSDVVASALVDMYAKCGSLLKARVLFDKMPYKNVVLWTVMVTGYAQNGVLEEALRLFREMPKRDVVSWNAMIAGYAQNGFVEKALETFKQMQLAGEKSASTTFASILPACAKMGDLEEGMIIHKNIIVSGFLSNVVVSSALVDMYAKCGRIQSAGQLFEKIPQRNVVSWNAMIAGYAQNGCNEKALETLNQMQLAGVKPDSTTFVNILSACAKMGALQQGMDIHQSIIEGGFLSDVAVANTLMGMYAKCGSILEARELFDSIDQKNVVSCTAMIVGYAQNGDLEEALRLFKATPQRDVVSWNAMIAGCAKYGFVEKALQIFKEMQLAGVKPVSTTFASILPACAKMGALEQGIVIHQSIIENGFLSDVVVASALVDMYAKCGSMHTACGLFDKIPHKNVVSWNAMIAGHAQNGIFEKALEIFKQMQLAGVKADSTTFVSVLPACAKMGAFEQGKDIHQRTIECGFYLDVVVASAMVDMYAKCGSIHMARKLFDKMPQRNLISWNAMIAGYAQNGLCKDAIDIFKLMNHSGIYPDHVSLTCLLLACSHAGLVDEGCKYFNSVGDSYSYCITPTIDHYVCMVDLLGRAGYLEETLKFIIKMPVKPVMVVWTCFLGACRTHKSIQLGVFTAALLLDLDPKKAATYVLLSNIYAEVGRRSEVQMVRRLMKDRGIKKTPGCSWIEAHNKVHVFPVGDRSHPQTQEIYAKLAKLNWEMKESGYFPDSGHVLNDVEEEEKEFFLSHHSEKLAIAFGLLNITSGTTIRVVKNLRVCVDCHTATKFISMITGRQIVVRDANRFHHFKQGQCSCGDYW